MSVSHRGLLLDLEDYGFRSARELERLGRLPITVKIGLGRFPSVGALQRFTPKERAVRIRAHYRRLFERLRPLLPEGTRPADREYRSCTCTVPARTYGKLRRHPSVRSLLLEDVPGRRRRKPRRPDLEWFSVQARFATQLEGVTRGMQRVEDRIVMVRARDYQDAARRAQREFRDYEKPYIGATNLLVRRKFEKILDIYSLPPVDFDGRPVEVFSKFRSRRLRPETGPGQIPR
jgi:hypothetical protein